MNNPLLSRDLHDWAGRYAKAASRGDCFNGRRLANGRYVCERSKVSGSRRSRCNDLSAKESISTSGYYDFYCGRGTG